MKGNVCKVKMTEPVLEVFVLRATRLARVVEFSGRSKT